VSHTDLRDLSPPAAVHEAVAALAIDAGAERVPLRSARGRVLAERVAADLDVPGFDRSALDGYAVRASDTGGAGETPVTLTVVGRVSTGERPAVSVDAGEAAGIATGAVMPPGADAMVPVESVTEGGESVQIHESVTVGDNVAPAGGDVAAGQRALGPGTRLTEREIGLLAALGVARVPVRRRPRVGIVPTGDELVSPGESLDHRAGQIHDVNTETVAAAVTAAGGEPDVRERVGDDPEAVTAAVRAAAVDCELVLTSGATSVGEADVLREVVTEYGDLLLHGAAVKPGKPVLVGRVTGAAGDGDDEPVAGVVGLPGYPVSALTTFRTFVAPALRAAAGLPEPETATLEGEMAVTETVAGPRRRLVAVAVVEDGQGRRLVYPVDRGSGAVTTLTNADGVVETPADVDRLAAGEPVTVELFSADTRVPGALVAGESDPALWTALDAVDARHLAVGSRPGRERLRQGVADVAVVAGPHDAGGDSDASSGATDGDSDTSGGTIGESDHPTLAAWRREWGLVVPPENPDDVAGVADLVDRDLRLANRGPDSGLRTSLAQLVAECADERGIDRHDAVAAIDGFGSATRGLESPARRVLDGRAAVGVGLRVTATRLDLGFVPLGWQPVRVLVSPDRREKPGVEAFTAALSSASFRERLSELPGYAPAGAGAGAAGTDGRGQER